MKLRYAALGCIMAVLATGSLAAQTPVLGSIEAPYAALQSSVHMAGTAYGRGAVAYGPAGTPLVLTGSDLGAGGTIQFIPYVNGSPGTAVSATATEWTQTMIFVPVPSGATSGLVKVTVEGRQSNGLPFIVVPGTYAGSCPAYPSNSQLQITTASLSDGTVGQAYSAPLSASGGTQTYTWSISAGTLPNGLSLNASTGTISGTPTTAGGPVDLTVQVTDSSHPSQTDQAILSLNIESQTLTAATIYTYAANYDGVGNVTSYSDSTDNNSGSIMGTWTFQYDALNRLVSGASGSTGPYANQNACWAYDDFGNRTMQSLQTSACSNAGNVASTLVFSSANQLSGVIPPGGGSQSPSTLTYDAAGDVTNDTHTDNTYVYDAEGRVCAFETPNGLGGTTMVGYLYDGDGIRVAKGTITSMNCDPASNGFTLTEDYVLGPSGEELTQLSGSGQWQRTNVLSGGKQLATYDTNGLHYQIDDPLGTRRMQTNAAGQPETDIQSLPYGDGLATATDQYAPATADDATPLHFTGKERDTESGNDYFGARYYASTMGRFLSPDEPFVGQHPDDPQSWNLYSYGLNNPVSNTDDDGHDVNVCTSNQFGQQQCTEMSNDQYQAAQQAGNGGLNVPTLDQVGTNGSGNITDANGNTVGTATYVSDGPLDPYTNASGYALLGAASKVVNTAGSIEMSVMAPWAGALAGCTSGDSGGACAANLALSVLPEVGELKAGATLLREAAAAGKGAEILEKAGGAAAAAKDFEALKGVEQVDGTVRIKTLSDGSKAVLYDSTGGSGRTTISIQDASGHTNTKIRY